LYISSACRFQPSLSRSRAEAGLRSLWEMSRLVSCLVPFPFAGRFFLVTPCSLFSSRVLDTALASMSKSKNCRFEATLSTLSLSRVPPHCAARGKGCRRHGALRAVRGRNCKHASVLSAPRSLCISVFPSLSLSTSATLSGPSAVSGGKTFFAFQHLQRLFGTLASCGGRVLRLGLGSLFCGRMDGG